MSAITTHNIWSGRRVLFLIVFLIGLGTPFLQHFHSSGEIMQEASNLPQINVDLPHTTSLQFLSQKNQSVTWGQFSGVTRLVYFGYTNCPDICPTGLYKISKALKIVENRNVFLPIFITVDPTHDISAEELVSRIYKLRNI